MSDKYGLRLYDTTLITFELTIGELGGYTVNIVSIGEPRELYPI